MPDRSVEHATLAIERTLDAPLQRAFAAWSDPALREAPSADSWDAVEHEEFRVGGEKRMSFGPRSGPRYREEGRYEDIVPDRRVVYGYSIFQGDVRITTSLQTIEFVAQGARTRMILTEQLAIFDAGDKAADRERGIAAWLDRFADELTRRSRTRSLDSHARLQGGPREQDHSRSQQAARIRCRRQSPGQGGREDRCTDDCEALNPADSQVDAEFPAPLA